MAGGVDCSGAVVDGGFDVVGCSAGLAGLVSRMAGAGGGSDSGGFEELGAVPFGGEVSVVGLELDGMGGSALGSRPFRPKRKPNTMTYCIILSYG